MGLDKLQLMAGLFLQCLYEVDENEAAEATAILQDLIQKSMVKLSKGKVKTIIFEAVKNSQPAEEGVEAVPVEQTDGGARNGELDLLVTSMFYGDQETAAIEEVVNDEVAEPMEHEEVPATPDIFSTPEPRRGRKPTHDSPNYDITNVVLNSGEKAYKCGICDRIFKDKSNLMRHFRSHTGERPYTCTECNRGFTQKTHLQTHVLIHTGERPFSCSLCEKTFAAKRTLKQHMRSHTGEKPFKCEICDRSFAFKQKLQSHAMTHTGEKPFECSECNRKFNRKDALKVHKCGWRTTKIRVSPEEMDKAMLEQQQRGKAKTPNKIYKSNGTGSKVEGKQVAGVITMETIKTEGDQTEVVESQLPVVLQDAEYYVINQGADMPKPQQGATVIVVTSVGEDGPNGTKEQTIYLQGVGEGDEKVIEMPQSMTLVGQEEAVTTATVANEAPSAIITTASHEVVPASSTVTVPVTQEMVLQHIPIPVQESSIEEEVVEEQTIVFTTEDVARVTNIGGGLSETVIEEVTTTSVPGT